MRTACQTLIKGMLKDYLARNYWSGDQQRRYILHILFSCWALAKHLSARGGSLLSYHGFNSVHHDSLWGCGSLFFRVLRSISWGCFVPRNDARGN